jgi:hypothetical protein
METIFDYYNYYKNTPGDIHEHMETIYKHALECDHITEMGVRHVVTTWAFLLARPKKLVSYDAESCPNVERAKQLAPTYGVDFEFNIRDTGNPNTVITPTDLLFLDTWHIYEQLKQELMLHGDYARKYIIMHDTTLYGDNRAVENYDCYVKPGPEGKGLWPAITEFLEENKNWVITHRYENCNGLTILKRIF